MKRIYKSIPLAVLLCFTGLGAHAQRGYTAFTYNIAIPAGETSDYIRNQTSWRGAGVELGRYIFSDKFSIGIGANWNVFNNVIRGESVQLTDTFTLSGVQFRYINALPVYVTGKYYFGNSDNKLVPYAGLGVGTAFVRNDNNIGQIQFYSKGWQFAIYPEIGLKFKAFRRAELLLSGRYNKGFATSKVPDLSYATINLGITYSY